MKTHPVAGAMLVAAADLISRAEEVPVAGDNLAFEDLIKRYNSPLFNYLNKLAGA